VTILCHGWIEMLPSDWALIFRPDLLWGWWMSEVQQWKLHIHQLKAPLMNEYVLYQQCITSWGIVHQSEIKSMKNIVAQDGLTSNLIQSAIMFKTLINFSSRKRKAGLIHNSRDRKWHWRELDQSPWE